MSVTNQIEQLYPVCSPWPLSNSSLTDCGGPQEAGGNRWQKAKDTFALLRPQKRTVSNDGMTHASAGGLLLDGGAVNRVIKLCKTEVKASTYGTSNGSRPLSAASEPANGGWDGPSWLVDTPKPTFPELSMALPCTCILIFMHKLAEH